MDDSRRNRRAVLGAWAAALASGIAGCSASGTAFGDEEDGSTDAPSDAETGTTTSEAVVPRVSFDFETGAGTLAVTHAAGDTVAVDRLLVSVDGEVAFETGAFQNGYGAGSDAENGWAGDVEAGDRLVLDPRDGFPAEASARVIWRSGDESAVIGEHVLPAVLSRTAKLGLLVPETGSFEEFGPPLRDAALLAVEQVNEANVPITVDARTEDTASDISTGTQGLQTLANGGYRAVVGPLNARIADRVAEDVAQTQRTVCCPLTLSSLPSNEFVYHTVPRTAMTGGALADLAASEDGVESAAIVSVDFEFTRRMADAFAETYESAGGTVEERTEISFNASSFDRVVDTLLEPDPDVLVPLLYPPVAVPFLESYYGSYGGDERILCPFMLEDETIPQEVDHSLTGVRGVSPGRSVSVVEQRYRDAYDGEPDLLSVHAYDAAAVCLLANARAGSNDGAAIRDEMRAVANPGGRTVTPDSLADGVAAAAAGETVAYRGAGSSVDFTSEGNLRSADFEVWRYTDDGTEGIETLTHEP